jgi:hypothetical protein
MKVKEEIRMTSVVVEVKKGMVTEIYSNDKNLQLVVVDWDFPDNREPGASQGFMLDPVALESMPTETRSLVQRTVS